MCSVVPRVRTIQHTLSYGDSLATMALELPLLRITEATGFGGTCKCMREPAAMLLTGLGAFLVLLLSKNRVVIYVFFACAAGLRGLCASFASTQQR